MIQFLRSLLRTLTKFSVRNSNAPVNPSHIDPSERITRYTFDSKKIKKSGVKYAAFLPESHKGTWETSVYRTDGLADAPVWEIGEMVGTKRSQTLKGRADLLAEVVQKTNPLRILPEISDHPRHAIIVGWPPEKEGQMELALVLANEATGYRR